jgi:hypothetical protein
MKLDLLKFLILSLVWVLLTGLTVSLGLSTTSAQSKRAQSKTEFQYAAKFICGNVGPGEIVSPGIYFTVINVRNPSRTNSVVFTKKFTHALPFEKSGKITGVFEASLAPDAAMGIDCGNIYAHSAILTGRPIEGYVVINSPAQLDVVSIYTAGSPEVQTLFTERVPFRRVAKPWRRITAQPGTAGP